MYCTMGISCSSSSLCNNKTLINNRTLKNLYFGSALFSSKDNSTEKCTVPWAFLAPHLLSADTVPYFQVPPRPSRTDLNRSSPSALHCRNSFMAQINTMGMGWNSSLNIILSYFCFESNLTVKTSNLSFFKKNKKVLLRERKWHTARRVAIAIPCYSGGRGGVP